MKVEELKDMLSERVEANYQKIKELREELKEHKEVISKFEDIDPTTLMTEGKCKEAHKRIDTILDKNSCGLHELDKKVAIVEETNKNLLKSFEKTLDIVESQGQMLTKLMKHITDQNKYLIAKLIAICTGELGAFYIVMELGKYILG
jgi:hypothetical protein